MKLLYIFVLTLFVNFSFATNFYVDPNSTGTNSGTLANPWKTLAAITQSSINAGDSLLFKRGTTITGTLTWTRSGSAGNPIVIGAYGTGANPVFTGTGSTIAYLFYQNNRNYITWRDLTITDPTLDTTVRTVSAKIQRVWGFDGTSTGNKVIKCDVSLCGVGIYFVGPANMMDSCRMTHLRMVVNTNNGAPPGNDDDYGANPFVMSSSKNIVTHNYFSECWATSFDYGFDGGFDIISQNLSEVVDSNYIAYNLIQDCNGGFEVTAKGAGNHSRGNVIAYNLFLNTESCMYFQANTTADYTGTIFANNVVVQNEVGRLNERALFGKASGTPLPNTLILRNNIFYLTSGVDVVNASAWSTSNLIHTNNLYSLTGGSVPNFTLNASEVLGASVDWVSTAGSNPLLWNYNLLSTSPARNIGVAVSAIVNKVDFIGNPVPSVPDAGAFQYIAPITPPPPPQPNNTRIFILVNDRFNKLIVKPNQ